MKASWKRWIFGIVLPLLLILFLYLLQMILMHFPSIGEAYAKSGFIVFSYIPAKISSLVPISLTEVFIVTLVFSSPLLIAWLVIRIRRAVKEKSGKKFFFNFGRVVAWVLFSLYTIFMLLHGLNYTRYSLDDKLGFGQRKYSVEELMEVTEWVISELNSAREACAEDENGVMTYPGGVPHLLSDMEDIYEDASKKIPQIKGVSARPKNVMLSHYWSYTYITGMYFPFFVEANINTDVTFAEMIYTICHEMSHLHGYAVENDATLAGLLVALSSDCPEVRYSGLREALELILMDLAIAFNNDSEGLDEFMRAHPVHLGYFRDSEAINNYWDSIDPPKIVSDVSSATNNAFLKANQQKDGVKSYNMPTSIMADYYFTFVKGES
ncbi:MAG: DUF3810 domain-containing protein [Clostridiales bacterium]|nr:DUF3810 domain-containing protein [Clostridiales bacterium]